MSLDKITLAAARVNAGFTRPQVAKMLDVTKVTVGNWENGRAKPSLAVKIALSTIYKIPIDEIIFPKD